MEIIDYLNKIQNEQLKESVLKMLEDTETQMRFFPAAIRFHHNEKGGLYRHIKEVLWLSLSIYGSVKQELVKRFIFEDDVILVAFIHDMEKLDKYKENSKYDANRKWEKGYNETPFGYNYSKIDMNDTAKTVRMCNKYGIGLTDLQMNALTFAHGGFSLDKGNMNPLAIIIHSADMLSSVMFKEVS